MGRETRNSLPSIKGLDFVLFKRVMVKLGANSRSGIVLRDEFRDIANGPTIKSIARLLKKSPVWKKRTKHMPGSPDTIVRGVLSCNMTNYTVAKWEHPSK